MKWLSRHAHNVDILGSNPSGTTPYNTNISNLKCEGRWFDPTQAHIIFLMLLTYEKACESYSQCLEEFKDLKLVLDKEQYETEMIQILSVLCGALCLGGDDDDEVRNNSLTAIKVYGLFIYGIVKG